MTGEDIGILCFTASDLNVLYRGNYFVKTTRWVEGATAGDVCQLVSSSGSIVFEGEADGPHYTDPHPVYKIINGLKLTQLGSGKLFVYLA